MPANYLKLKRARVILGCFLASSLVLVAIPSIDLGFSSLFYDQGFALNGQPWYERVRDGMVGFLYLAMGSVLAVYGYNRLARRNVGGIDGRRVCFLALVLAVGAGLIVNTLLKENFGRARPRDIEQFGGTLQFTPAFVISHECKVNCSFASGEGAASFLALALAMALNRRRAALIAGAAYGTLVSLSRIAAGAHFLSDSVVSFFVMLLVMDVLFYYLVSPGLGKRGA